MKKVRKNNWEDHEYCLWVPCYGSNSYSTSQALRSPANLISQDEEVERVLDFYKNSPWRLPVDSVKAVLEVCGEYYSATSSCHIGNLNSKKGLDVWFYEKLTAEKYNPLVVKSTIRMLEKGDRRKLSGGDKLLAKKIGIEGFWDTVKIFAESPVSPVAGWAATASRNELIVSRLQS